MTPLRGITLKILSVLAFSLMAICVKAVAPHVPPGETVFFRAFIALPLILGWLATTGTLREGLTTRYPMGHVWRGLVGTAAMAFNFMALGLLPLPEATTLGYAAPLLTVIFAAMFLGEEVRIFRLTAVFVGLIGVVIVLAPRLTMLSFASASKLEAVGAFAALSGAMLTALAQVFVRKLVGTEKTGAIVFYFQLTASLLALLTLPFGWVVPTPLEAALLLGAGIFGGLGQILLTQSYRHAPTSVVAPFDYVSMIFALTFGYLIFGEVPTGAMLTGAALIVAAGLFIIWRERQLGLQRGARRVLTPQG